MDVKEPKDLVKNVSNSKLNFGKKSLASLKSQSELFPIFFIVGVLLSFSIILAVQNETNLEVVEQDAVEVLVDPVADEPVEEVLKDPVEGNQTDEELSGEPSGETTSPEDVETNVSLPETSPEIVDDGNETEPPSEEGITNATSDPISNETSSMDETPQIGAPSSSPKEEREELDLDIVYPSKITRGESVDLESKVVNVGTVAVREVSLTWELPEGFEIISGNGIKDCGILSKDDFCESKITVQSSISTNLGENEIMVKVAYE